MTRVILPPIVEQNMAIDSAMEAVESARARGDYLRWFDRELKQLDSRLELVRAREKVAAPGFVPGYWHVVRDNSDFGAPKSIYPIQDHEGGFVEPSSAVLEHLRRSDLQRPGALEEVRRREAKARETMANARRFAAADRREELATRIKAIESPGVSMAPGWTNSKRGRRGKAA